jgi:heme-degrading monooxygenase HmoA
MFVSIVKFRSTLPDEAVVAMFDERADRYLELPGLVEKLYLRFRDTGEFGAVYVWETEEALNRFRKSDLARTIPQAYAIEGAAHTELADVCLVVQPPEAAVLRAR